MKIHVKVKPHCKEQKIEQTGDNNFTIRLQSPPVDGKANQELITLLAKKFQVPKSYIEIKTGLSSKNKLIEINSI